MVTSVRCGNREMNMSIFEETKRLYRIKLVLLKAGFLDYMVDSELDRLIDTIILSDLDIMVSQDEWVMDVVRTLQWLRKSCSLDLIDDRGLDLLHEGVRKYSGRLEDALDEDDGESWKKV